VGGGARDDAGTIGAALRALGDEEPRAHVMHEEPEALHAEEQRTLEPPPPPLELDQTLGRSPRIERDVRSREQLVEVLEVHPLLRPLAHCLFDLEARVIDAIGYEPPEVRVPDA